MPLTVCTFNRQNATVPKPHTIPTLEVCVKIDTWKTNIYFINNDSYNEINIASQS